MIAKTGRKGSYFTSAARLVIPNNAATTGPMQQTDAPSAAMTDPAIPARVTRSCVRSFISLPHDPPWGGIVSPVSAPCARPLPPPHHTSLHRTPATGPDHLRLPPPP